MPDYIRPIIDEADDDPAAIQQAMEDRLATLLPGWQARAASPMRYLLEAASHEIAETRRAATGEGQTFDAIAKFIGEETFAIEPEAAVPATGAATFTVKDGNGPYPIEAGLQLTLIAADGSEVGFEVVDDVTVAAGQLSTPAGGVAIVALEAGTGGNGLLEFGGLEEISDFITGVTLVAPTSGGVDGETDSEYLDRFRRAALRFSPRLITARDLELYAQDWPGALRAVAYDLRDPGLNEKQTISHNGTGGSGTLVVEGNTTAALTWNSTAAQIATAINAMFGGDTVVRVSGGPWPAAVTVEFINGLAGSNRGAITVGTNSLTPGGSVFTITTTQNGVAPTTNQERKATVVAIDAAGESLSSAERTALETAMLAGVESGKLVYVREPSYGVVNVVFTATSYPDFTPASVEAAAEAAVASFLSPANWGIPRYGDQLRWLDEPLVRFREVIAVLESVEGLWHVDTLTINGAANTDYTLPGPKPNLPRPGTIAGTVTA